MNDKVLVFVNSVLAAELVRNFLETEGESESFFEAPPATVGFSFLSTIDVNSTFNPIS